MGDPKPHSIFMGVLNSPQNLPGSPAWSPNTFQGHIKSHNTFLEDIGVLQVPQHFPGGSLSPPASSWASLGSLKSPSTFLGVIRVLKSPNTFSKVSQGSPDPLTLSW